MRIGSIWLGCKATLALVIVVSFVAPIALGQQLICPVSGANFQLHGPCTVTKIEVSHSSSGLQGSVKLMDANGVEYGPWNADTSSSIWKVYPNKYLAAGSYRLVDSDPGTYKGQAWIYGSNMQEPPPPSTNPKPASPKPTNPQPTNPDGTGPFKPPYV
jgi:hypothetical protein